jgi:hypothetical protein
VWHPFTIIEGWLNNHSQPLSCVVDHQFGQGQSRHLKFERTKLKEKNLGKQNLEKKKKKKEKKFRINFLICFRIFFLEKTLTLEGSSPTKALGSSAPAFGGKGDNWSPYQTFRDCCNYHRQVRYDGYDDHVSLI